MPPLKVAWAAPRLTLRVATIGALLPTTRLLGLALPWHAASSVGALTDAEPSAAWLEPPLPYLEGKEVVPSSGLPRWSSG